MHLPFTSSHCTPTTTCYPSTLSKQSSIMEIQPRAHMTNTLLLTDKFNVYLRVEVWTANWAVCLSHSWCFSIRAWIQRSSFLQRWNCQHYCRHWLVTLNPLVWTQAALFWFGSIKKNIILPDCSPENPASTSSLWLQSGERGSDNDGDNVGNCWWVWGSSWLSGGE